MFTNLAEGVWCSTENDNKTKCELSYKMWNVSTTNLYKFSLCRYNASRSNATKCYIKGPYDCVPQ